MFCSISSASFLELHPLALISTMASTYCSNSRLRGPLAGLMSTLTRHSSSPSFKSGLNAAACTALPPIE